MKRISNALAALSLVAILALGAASARAANTNLIANPQVTQTGSNGQPTNWAPNSWGSNVTRFNYLTNSGHGDNTSLDISMSNHSSGDAKWIPDASPVIPGQKYVYNDWYRSNVSTELDAEYINVNGTISYAYLATETPNNSWAQAMTSFTVPANVSKVSVIHILYSDGTLQTDDFTLTQAVAPSNGNLIVNPSFNAAIGNTPLDWNQGSWGSNNAHFTYNTNLGRDNSTSATVSISNYTSGDAKWYANPVAVTPGKNYTYSDWYESNTTTHVVAAFIDNSGNYTYTNLTDAAAANAWTPYTADFVVPANTAYVTIFHLLGSTGTLTIDDIDLSLTPVTSNLIQNSDVAITNPSDPSLPLDWQNNAWGINTASFSYLPSGGRNGNRALKVNMTSYTSGDAKWFPNAVAVTPDAQYKFSDYYKATTATELDVAFNMSDGSIVYNIIGLPQPTSTWKKFTTEFSVPIGAQTMTVYHIIHSVGTLTIDNESLQTYTPTGFNYPMVTLTFDDGYNDIYTNGLPILQKYGFTSTQNIITKDINTPDYMTVAQVRAFHKAGDEIASHTVTHDDMLTEPSSQWIRELALSKWQLERWIGTPVTDMAYPNGLYNNQIIRETSWFYSGARGVEDGLNSKDNFNPLDIKVQNVFNTTTTAQIADWVKQAKTTNTWLVLVYHSVDVDAATAGIYNVTPAQLNSQLAAVKASGVKVVTMHNAIHIIEKQLTK